LQVEPSDDIRDASEIWNNSIDVINDSGVPSVKQVTSFMFDGFCFTVDAF